MILAFSNGWGLAVALAATASYAALALASRRRQQQAAKQQPGTAVQRVPRALLALAWMLHGAVLALGLLGEPPRFGFGPALSITVWLVLTVYAIESRLFPRLLAHWALAALGGAAVLVALVFPGSTYHAIASPWLPLHWALGLASYGLFAAAVVHGWLMTRAERAMRLPTQGDSGLPLMTLERLTFRFVEAGFALLSATLLVGWVFAEQLYGPKLVGMWNHKTVFSMLAWLTFALLLIGRARLGWRGGKAVRVLYVGSGLLLLAYVGSRFVIEVVLGRA
ncbi:MAG: cytochrome c biogenesis protein CcsA [Polaromonas sp.]|nr:cytochrome c biogenesis protein CcsA [Polaromonas sp.]